MFPDTGKSSGGLNT